MTAEELEQFKEKTHYNYFPLENVLRLRKAGLSDEDMADLMTAQLTVNKAREKLHLPPLDDPLADRLFCVDPYGIYHALGPACVDKVRDRFVHSESDLVRKFWQNALPVRNESIEQLLIEGSIDLAEHDRMLAACLLPEQIIPQPIADC